MVNLEDKEVGVEVEIPGAARNKNNEKRDEMGYTKFLHIAIITDSLLTEPLDNDFCGFSMLCAPL
jgi:hypothetical protein